MSEGLFDFGRAPKRTLKFRDKEILYEKAGRKCEACEKEISFTEMEAGHKQAYSRGGPTTLKNSVCLCPTCNRLQGTDSFEVFMKKRYGKTDAKTATDLPPIPAPEKKEVAAPETGTAALQIDAKAYFRNRLELNPLLQKLSIKQLKELCDTLGVERPQTKNVGSWTYVPQAPSKSAYIKRITKSDIDTEKIKSVISAICDANVKS